MKFYSTRGRKSHVTFKQAVLKGLADDGGLFMPFSIPIMPEIFFESLTAMSLPDVAYEVSQKFIEDVPPEVLRNIVHDAFNFDAPLVQLDKNQYVLELFHGPTLSFKDFAARFMSRIMAYYVKNADRPLTILVATSGDTGSAVAHGFYNMPGIKVVVLYPSKQISEIQEQQIATLGGNISALEISGTFDDCQKLVKQAFMDEELRKNLWLTSANSINIARLIPQSFYYFYAVAQLQRNDLPVIFSVPSGNFGNLTGGLFAQKMGLPIQCFIAATNANDTVPQYLKSAVYKPKPSIRTISNAMDVGDPSNFNRIMDLYDNDFAAISNHLYAASFTDEQTSSAIYDVFQKHRYLFDPHSAVGFLGLSEYKRTHSQEFAGIILATAHPAKFKDIVEPVTKEQVEIPKRLQECLKKPKHSIQLANDFIELKKELIMINPPKADELSLNHFSNLKT